MAETTMPSRHPVFLLELCKKLLYGAIDALQLFGFNDIRRENINDISERTQQNVPFKEKRIDLLADGIIVRGLFGGPQLDGQNRSEAPDITYRFMILQ